jgi:hypothetical protein
MTDQEREVLKTLAEAHKQFVALPEQHPADMGEWVQNIHALQRIVMARAAERNHPDFFYQPNKP